ncbi:MAG: AAA family ATPase [Planctomycetaceae bacterium]
MRIHRLHIPAFGPFTNLELVFPSEKRDLHVIYGENEAGKSSLLRAIRDLLFGIHSQSPDNFRHDYKDLRVLGEIENREGQRLVFQRRKGNKNTLLDQNGNPLPDSALSPFLGSIDLAYFSAMFGLGGSELREGAVQLLKGEGEIGSALFSASLGGTPIQHVLDELLAESEQFFKGRATANVSIRPAANRYKQLQKQSRESEVKADTWDQLEKDLERQEAARKSLEHEIDGFTRELTWVDRCEDALSSVGRLSEEMKALSELPALPDVASDFVARARLARGAVGTSTDRVQSLSNQFRELERQLANCTTTPAVVADADALDVLHQDLGAYRERKRSLTGLKERLAGIEPVLRAGMKTLEIPGELDALETLRQSSALHLSCEEAANRLREALSQQSVITGRAEELKNAIASDEYDLLAVPDTDLTPLREALADAADATEADRTLATSQAVVENLIRNVATERTLVPDVPENPDAALRLAVPAPAVIRSFRERFDDIERDIKDATAQLRDENDTLKNLQDELSRLERRGRLPSEESLKEARDHRDRGWQLVLADWKGDGAQDALEPDLPLEVAFPQAILNADRIADQLRIDAAVVAQAEEKRLQIRNCHEKITTGNATLSLLQSSLEQCHASWVGEWAAVGVQPRSPDEMAEWREHWVELRETINKLKDAEVAVATRKFQVQHARETLAAALMNSPEKPFSVLFEAARLRVQQGEESTGQRKEIGKRLAKQRKELATYDQKAATLRQAVEVAEANWKLRCQTVGLSEDTSPESGLKLLQERKELLTKFDSWKQLSGEANAMVELIHRYEQSVSEKALALRIEADSTEGQATGLRNALTQARKSQTEHDQLVVQIQSAKADLTTAQREEALALRAMEELMQLSQLDAPAELEPLLANLEKRTAIQNQIDSLRETLSGLARGQSVEDFIARVQAENADELPQRKILLENNKADKTIKIQGVQAELMRLNNEKSRLEKAGDAAADFQQQAESVAAALKHDAARFVRLRLAAHFLRTQIERFREENQGPLLEKSGHVFRQMTRSAFDGLAAEFNQHDVPVMVGRRADGSNVPVEGMSEGSRDQLYLSLRLAAMDRYLEEHEPMPLILDDLLITFDNERTRAILPLLASLAGRTQVFLFTHHEHLVELCRDTMGEGQFSLHRLGS